MPQRSLNRANCGQGKKWLPIPELFEDVYHEVPTHLREQQEGLTEHLAEFGQHYPILDKYAK